ncbi:MetQ/NlpA family ABC transporter substrate-binding protein [Lactococcus lactis]
MQVELKCYENYNIPNEDLEKGTLDLNAFQHQSFFA